MTVATPAQRDLARWILIHEMSDGPEAEALVDAFERTCQKLCRRLARIVTVSGSQVLLARALRLGQGEFSFLNEVRAGDSTETCLEGLPPRGVRKLVGCW